MTKHKYEYAVPLPFSGPPEKVFKALTEKKALETWFAKNAEVDPKKGGKYHFWGKHTLDPKTKDKAGQKITDLEKDKSLSFFWHFLGRDSEVTWVLAPAEGGQTSVTIRHTLESLPEIGRAKELVDDMWRLFTGNLFFYVMGDERIFLPDFDNPNPEVIHKIHINAPREKVFKALITPEAIKQWFGAPAPVVEPRVGGKFGFGYSYELDGKTVTPPPMKILEFEENQKLVTTWPDWRGDKNVPDQQVAWILEDAEGGTKLTLIHSGFTRAVDVSDYPLGWVPFMDGIKKVAEGI